MSTQQIEWDQAAVDRLTELWASGMKTAAMAEELGISKNAVIGKAHRLGLEERRSPILPAWTDEQNARFSERWNGGTSIAQMAEEFRISEEWVATKRRRLKLPPRGPGGRRALEGSTLPSIPIASPPPAPVMRAPEPVVTPSPVKSTAAVAPRPAVPEKPVAPPAPIRVVPPAPQPCCWPIGEPGSASFHFCGGTASAGKPYCADHCAVAFVPAPQRRDHLRRIDRDVRNGMARTGSERWV